VKEKERKITELEGKIFDMEEDKIFNIKEYQEEMDSQKNRYEL
jgi:hypothetical protein